MTSITKIIILITAIIAISGETLDYVDQSDPPVYYRVDLMDTLYHLMNLKPPVKKGCIDSPIVNCSSDRPDNPEIRQPIENVFNKRVFNKNGIRRERRQALVKTNGPDDGPNSVMSLLTRSSSPLRSTIRNRNRRSSSTPDISSNKNTTMKVRPTPVNSQPPKISNSKQLIITFLDAITSPYLSIY